MLIDLGHGLFDDYLRNIIWLFTASSFDCFYSFLATIGLTR